MPLERFLKSIVMPGPGKSRRIEVLNGTTEPVLTIQTTPARVK